MHKEMGNYEHEGLMLITAGPEQIPEVSPLSFRLIRLGPWSRFRDHSNIENSSKRLALVQ